MTRGLLDSNVNDGIQCPSSKEKQGHYFLLSMEDLPVKGYERVIKVTDPSVDLTAIIAIHSLALGPALGGIRILPYSSFDEALEDVLRLAKGMTYKAAAAEVGLGGGKAVILADPKSEKSPEKLRAFGAAVHRLEGLYVCAEDVGCTVDDCQIIRKSTPYVVGLSDVTSSGDPAPFTAWGVFRGVQSVLKKVFGSSSVKGRKIAIQGLGCVGGRLAEYLFWAGARLIVSDIDERRSADLGRKYGAYVVDPKEILKVECDVLAPCALGGILNEESVLQLRCKAVAGAANNQLKTEAQAQEMKARGILYAPDFVINAGGLLNVTAELAPGGYNPIDPRDRISQIYDHLLAIYEIAEKSQESTHAVAVALADHRIKYQIGKRINPLPFPSGDLNQ